jgi:hypothetical protein
MSRMGAALPPALGVFLALAATLQWGSALVEAVQYPSSLTCWLIVAATGPLWLLACLGAVWLLRGKPAGFVALALAMLVPMGGCFVTQFPGWLSTFRVERYSGGTSLEWWRLPTGVIQVLLHSGPGFSYWPLPVFRFNLILLAVLLGAWVVASRQRARGPADWYRPLLAIGFGACVAAPMIIAGGQGLASFEDTAASTVQRGEEADEAGDVEAALAQWQVVAERYRHTSAWANAVHHIGAVRQQQGRQREAILAFEQILHSRLNDTDPDATLAAMNHLIRHYACLGLSGCYEDLGDRKKALRYARHARDRYSLRIIGGACMHDSMQLQHRIERLEAQ